MGQQWISGSFRVRERDPVGEGVKVASDEALVIQGTIENCKGFYSFSGVTFGKFGGFRKAHTCVADTAPKHQDKEVVYGPPRRAWWRRHRAVGVNSEESVCSLCPSGFLLFKDFCMNEIDEAVPQLKFYEEFLVRCGFNGWGTTCHRVSLMSRVERIEWSVCLSLTAPLSAHGGTESGPAAGLLGLEAHLPDQGIAGGGLEPQKQNIKEYEKLDSEEERNTRSRQIYDVYIMKELLSCSHIPEKINHNSAQESDLFLSDSKQTKACWDTQPTPEQDTGSITNTAVRPLRGKKWMLRSDTKESGSSKGEDLHSPRSPNKDGQQQLHSPPLDPQDSRESQPFSKKAVDHVQTHLAKKQVPPSLFQPYIVEICDSLRGNIFQKFIESDKFTRFCQWKNVELNIHLTMNDFSVHRIIGRGGFGEVYGCRKADTGKMYAMKCLDKKRIKMKQGETLALNERIMLSLVSTGDCPFIVCMTYAFHTPDKLCFILDLMNGGDLHYHLSQHGVFSEKDMRFYAAEIILGLEHMHNRFVVYRDLKPANILLDEHGHVRISDLGLACDFSKKKPHASVGTHGYMAPEVLQKGTAYDSSADWFSLGCMLFKLLRGEAFGADESHAASALRRMALSLSLAAFPLPMLPGLTLSLCYGWVCLEYQQALPHEHRRQCSPGPGKLVWVHSPFRQHKTKDKHEIDRMTLTMNVELPDSFSPELKGLLEGLLQRDVAKRLGCLGRGASEVKEHVFFKGIDWQQVYLQKVYGEVNAADAFDIGSFDEEDTKGIKLLDSDQELYKNFPLVISERWQQEVAETVYDAVNSDTDKNETRKRAKNKQQGHEEDYALGKDCIMHGYMLKLGNPFLTQWQRRYFYLFPNRVEWRGEGESREHWMKPFKKHRVKQNLLTMEQIVTVEETQIKDKKCILLRIKGGKQFVLQCESDPEFIQWKKELTEAFTEAQKLLRRAPKVIGKGRTNVVELSKPPLTHRNSNGL
ncbi:hypothetical protein DNTS_032449 [Danionella cerebrum]|uniref:[beta-adrenergic-receptor] kinase n=1 Tax=Danionella cerebrum TaxID=2873325 RepID=A0A553Q3B2_9TELE|nr:hypothetical protein DNTS_032449 [Danionella translucida]